MTASDAMAIEAAAEIVMQKLEILRFHPVRLGCLSTETQAEAAQKKLAMIQEFFSTQDGLSNSREWPRRLLQALYDAEESIDKFHLREACRRHKALHRAARPLSALVPRYMLRRDLSNLVKAMEEFCQYLPGPEPASSSSHGASAPWQGQKLARMTSFWDRQRSMNFVCREAEKKIIMNQITVEAEPDVAEKERSEKMITKIKILITRIKILITRIKILITNEEAEPVDVAKSEEIINQITEPVEVAEKKSIMDQIISEMRQITKEGKPVDVDEKERIVKQITKEAEPDVAETERIRKLITIIEILIANKAEPVDVKAEKIFNQITEPVEVADNKRIMNQIIRDICQIFKEAEPADVDENQIARIMYQITKKAEPVDVLGISIVGKQGTGKTYLARRVYQEAMYLGFNSRAWVCVSASTDKREFLFEILKQVDKLARDLPDFNEIKKMLRQKMSEMKKFLIVLDDVHLSDRQLLQELLMIIPFPLPSRGYLITTTEDDKIAKIMNTAKKGPIKLERLDCNKSWEMLAMKLYGVPDESKLTSEQKKILNKFPALQLPLCISLLGGLLSNVGCATLANYVKMELSDLQHLSYHRLPVHLKPCFIYMVLFPIAFPIPTRRLVRLWLAEGLLDSHCCDRERRRTPEDVGESFILELVDWNVIDVVSWRADGSPKACQMLTSLYDMIRPNATSTGFLHVHIACKSRDGTNDPTSQQQLPAPSRDRARVRWFAEHTNLIANDRNGSFPNLNLGHMRSFLSFCLRRGMLTKDISTFLRKVIFKTDYNLLRVLDLEGVYKPSLQGVLHKLVLLRYLGLRSTVLDSIPNEVADLHYLETLDIKHTDITSLPSSLWKKARKLRHLHLNWLFIDLMKILKACSNNNMALAQLQTLSGLIIDEVTETSMTNQLNSLTTLKLYLRSTGADTSEAAGKIVADWISFRFTNLQSLTFGVFQIQKPKKEDKPAKKAESGKEAESAKEDKSTKEVESDQKPKPTALQICLLPELSLAEHHNLFELYLMGKLNNPIWTQLLPSSLRVLTLSASEVATDMMPDLGRLLRNLRTLRLLANSFQGTILRFIEDGFPSLVILKIWKLAKLEKVTIEQGALPHLKELELRPLDSMKIVEVEGISKCNELETIRVIGKKDIDGFVADLKKKKGKATKLYRATVDDGSRDDDKFAASLEYKLEE